MRTKELSSETEILDKPKQGVAAGGDGASGDGDGDGDGGSLQVTQGRA